MHQDVSVHPLRMKARRRSPFMLVLGILTAGAPASAAAAARGAGPRRDRAAVTDTTPSWRLGEVGWEEIPTAVGDPCEPWIRLKPKPRVEMMWQTGYQRTWISGRSWTDYGGRQRGRYQFTHDLGVLVRGRDGHLWGGTTSVIWQASRRTLYGFKGVRRWTLDQVSDAYVQVAPGVIVGGEESGLDISPGAMLDLEIGSRWVALTAGVHAVGWRTNVDEPWVERGDGTTVTYYLGGRCHGAVGLGVYCALLLMFLATYRPGYS